MFWGAKKLWNFFFKYFSNRIEKLHKMAFIYTYFFFWKSLKKLKKLELSPQNFRYDVLHLLYSGSKQLFGLQTWDSLYISISVISQQLLIVFDFYKAQLSNPSFELFSLLIIALWLGNLELRFSNLDFKPHVFNSWFLTQTDISFFRFLNFKQEKKTFSGLL
jgi:hypothetical protein